MRSLTRSGDGETPSLTHSGDEFYSSLTRSGEEHHQRGVSIFGGGIAGLTIAHHLIQKGFQVAVYELSNSIGGMAKSIRETINNIPTEHSWRGYWPFYYNCFNILKNIPFSPVESFELKTYSINDVSKHNSKDDLWTYYKGKVYNITSFADKHPGGYIILQAGGKDLEKVWKDNNMSWHESNYLVQNTLKDYQIGILNKESFELPIEAPLSVYDNLSPKVINMALLRNIDLPLSNSSISIRDYPYLFYLFLSVLLTDKRRTQYFNQPFLPLIQDKVSKSTQEYLTYFVCSTGLGINISLTSLAHFVLFVALLQSSFTLRGDEFYSSLTQSGDDQRSSIFHPNVRVMNGPTSEVWFNSWKTYLQQQGVIFYLNHELIQINHNQQEIQNCIVKFDGRAKDIKTDEYCFCLNPYNMIDVLQRSILPQLHEQHLYLKTIDTQIGFVIAFKRHINLDSTINGMVIMDSPWNIAFYSQDQIWNSQYSLGKDIKSLWSGTCILPTNNGSLFGKPASQLNREDCVKEIIHQLINCSQFQNIIQTHNDGLVLTEELVDFATIYGDWEWDGSQLESINKKWVNTYFNEQYRPKATTSLKNMYIGGAHCQTSMNIWTMESAVESGNIVVNEIVKKYNLPSVFHYVHQSSLIIQLIGQLDNLLYKIDLPNILKSSLIILCSILIYKLVKKL